MLKHALLLTRSAPIGIKVLYCLSMAGWKVSIAVDRASSILRWSRHVTGTLKVSDFDETDRATLAATIDDYCRSGRISVILGDAIGAAGLLNELQPFLQTPSYAPEPSQRLTQIHDKWLFYQQLNPHFLLPRTALLKDLCDLNERTVEWIGRPFLLKPLNGEAGHGVQRFDTCSDALSYQRTPGRYRALPLLIQQYIPEPDVGYSVISDKGNAVIDDVQYRDANDVRTFCQNAEVTALCRQIIAKLNYSGPAFIDLRKDEKTNRFYPLECNCRFWSTMTANAWMGINYADIAACLALGSQLHFAPGRLSTYHLPGTIARYLKQPQKFYKISGRNWLGFFQSVSDPLPHVFNLLS